MPRGLFSRSKKITKTQTLSKKLSDEPMHVLFGSICCHPSSFKKLPKILKPPSSTTVTWWRGKFVSFLVADNHCSGKNCLKATSIVIYKFLNSKCKKTWFTLVSPTGSKHNNKGCHVAYSQGPTIMTKTQTPFIKLSDEPMHVKFGSICCHPSSFK